MKKIFLGFLIGLILSMTSVVFAGNEITAFFTNFNFIVNGETKQLDKQPILVNGSSYLPVRAVAEMLGYEVIYHGDTQTIEFNSKYNDDKNDNNFSSDSEDVLGFTSNNPAPLNTPVEFQINNDNGTFLASLSVNKILRGEEAWMMIKEANSINKLPDEGYEYILTMINFELKDSSYKVQYDVNPFHFTLLSSEGIVYPTLIIIPPEPSFSGTLNSGESLNGWIAFRVNKNDDQPLIAYLKNSGGIWLQAYDDKSQSSKKVEENNVAFDDMQNNNENINIKGKEELLIYLNNNYSKLETPMGNWAFTFTIDENDSSILPYDYWIQTDWDSKTISPHEVEYSINYSKEEKDETKRLLRDFQKEVAEIAFQALPNKKIRGGFYTGFYKYPYSKVGYETITFLSWANYNDALFSKNRYEDSKITEFRWNSASDDYNFIN